MRLFSILTLMIFLAVGSIATAQNVTNQTKAVNFSANQLVEATISEYNPSTSATKHLTGVRIEIFNNTTQREELVHESHNQHRFSFNFRRGNSYILMLRKDGYMVKRVNIKIGVDDCISCFEGLNILTPASDNLTSSSIKLQMRKINDGDRVMIPELNFQGKSAVLTSASERTLDELAVILKDNSNITSELEVHTDSRGEAASNMSLSEKRARAIVQYLTAQGVAETDVFAKGYGEKRIINECFDGVNCNDTKHDENNRIVFKLHTSIGENPIYSKSLSSMLLDEGFKPFGKDNSTRVGDAKPKKIGAFDAPVEEVQEVKIPSTPKMDKIDEAKVAETAKATKSVYPKMVEQQAEKNKIAEAKKNEEVFSSANGLRKVSNAMNSIPVNGNQVTKICAYDKYIPFASQIAEDENDEGGLPQARNAISNVKLSNTSGMSTDGTAIYDPNTGERLMVRNGRATLVSNIYSGYKVELFTSELEIPNSHGVFKKHGKVYLDDTGVAFSYMIGSFVEKKSAENFLNTVILPNYPEAKIIKYKDGKRK